MISEFIDSPAINGLIYQLNGLSFFVLGVVLYMLPTSCWTGLDVLRIGTMHCRTNDLIDTPSFKYLLKNWSISTGLK